MTLNIDFPFTAVPNVIIDHSWKVLTRSAYILIIIIARKTLGWHKQLDNISLSQFQNSSGLTRTTCVKALRELHDQGFSIECKGGKNGKKYGLAPLAQIEQILESKGICVRSNSESKQNEDTQKDIGDDYLDHTSLMGGPLPVHGVDPQKTVKENYQNKNIYSESDFINHLNFPSNVDKEKFKQFMEMRKFKKKSLTYNGAVNLLERLASFGDSANESLSNAIIGNHDNVIPVKKMRVHSVKEKTSGNIIDSVRRF